MRQRDARTLGGLVVVVVAVLIAAWLLGDGEEDAARRADEAASRASGARDLGDAASGAAPVDAERAAESLPALVGVPVAEGDGAPPGEPLLITGRVVDVQGQTASGTPVDVPQPRMRTFMRRLY